MFPTGQLLLLVCAPQERERNKTTKEKEQLGGRDLHSTTLVGGEASSFLLQCRPQEKDTQRTDNSNSRNSQDHKTFF